MGCDMQPQGHVQIVINLIDFGMNLQEAGDAPRIYWDSELGLSGPTGGSLTDGGTVNLENGFSDATLGALVLRRHRLGRDIFFGGCRVAAGPGPANRASTGRRLASDAGAVGLGIRRAVDVWVAATRSGGECPEAARHL